MLGYWQRQDKPCKSTAKQHMSVNIVVTSHTPTNHQLQQNWLLPTLTRTCKASAAALLLVITACAC